MVRLELSQRTLQLVIAQDVAHAAKSLCLRERFEGHLLRASVLVDVMVADHGCQVAETPWPAFAADPETGLLQELLGDTTVVAQAQRIAEAALKQVIQIVGVPCHRSSGLVGARPDDEGR